MTNESDVLIETTIKTNTRNYTSSTILTCIYLPNMTRDSLLDTLTFADVPSRTVLTSTLQDGLIKKSAFATNAFIYHFDDIRDAIDMVLRRIRDKENKHILSTDSKALHFNSFESPPLFFKLDYSVRDHCLKMNELFENQDVKFVCSRACQDVLNCKSSISSINGDCRIIQHSTYQSLPSSTILITVQFDMSNNSEDDIVSFDSVDYVVREVRSHLSKFGSILACSELKRSLHTGSTFKFFVEYYRVSDSQAFLASTTSLNFNFLLHENQDVKVTYENVNLYDIDRDALFFSTDESVNNCCPTSNQDTEIDGQDSPQLDTNSFATYSSIASSMFTPPKSIDPSASANGHQSHLRRISNTSSISSNSSSNINSDDGFSGTFQSGGFEYNFEIDLEKIENGTDKRTTCMIRNIPNKYTQQMILDLVNESHRGCFDFLYLRMDFRNRCNVGYAFINFVNSSHIESFSKRVNGRRWARFNSDKVCHLTFARIQGIAALVDKFKNSKVMFEAPAFRPKLFHTSGLLAGQEAPFPQN